MTEKKMFDFAIWFISACLLAVIVTSCNPYAAQPTATVTASPAATVTAAAPRAATPTSETCTVETGVPAGNLNIRTGPGTSYGVIRVLAEGETLKVIERGAWLKVIDNQGTRGFINARYCQVQP